MYVISHISIDIGPTECKDLNRGRAYLADVAHRHLQSGVFNNVKDAVNYIIKKLKKKRVSKGKASHGLSHHVT